MTECDNFILWMKTLKDHSVMSDLEESIMRDAFRLQSGDKVFQSSAQADYLVDHLSDEVLYGQFLIRTWRKLSMKKDRINPTK